VLEPDFVNRVVPDDPHFSSESSLWPGLGQLMFETQ